MLWLVPNAVTLTTVSGYRFEALLRIASADLAARGLDSQVEVRAGCEATRSILAEALRLVHQSDGNLFAQTAELCREIVLVQASSLIGLSAMALPGVVFIQSRESATPLFYVEHLVHEVAHLALNAVVFRNHDFIFSGDPFGPSLVSPLRSDERSAYQVLHATFVLGRIAETFDALIDMVGAENRLEALGRLGLSLQGLLVGIRSLQGAGLRGLGEALLQDLVRCHGELTKRRTTLLQELDLEGQSIELDVPRLARANVRLAERMSC
jgi:HEXXH motif-containing protein